MVSGKVSTETTVSTAVIVTTESSAEIQSRSIRKQGLDAIVAKGSAAFTAEEIAEAIGCSTDKARGVISWLMECEYVVRHGFQEKRYWFKKEQRWMKDRINLYLWTGKIDKITIRRTPAWYAKQFQEYR